MHDRPPVSAGPGAHHLLVTDATRCCNPGAEALHASRRVVLASKVGAEGTVSTARFSPISRRFYGPRASDPRAGLRYIHPRRRRRVVSCANHLCAQRDPDFPHEGLALPRIESK